MHLMYEIYKQMLQLLWNRERKMILPLSHKQHNVIMRLNNLPKAKIHPITYLEKFSKISLGLRNTLTASLQRGKTPSPMSVLDITPNNLMVRFQ